MKTTRSWGRLWVVVTHSLAKFPEGMISVYVCEEYEFLVLRVVLAKVCLMKMKLSRRF